MQVFVPRELSDGETRVPMTPDTVGRLVKKGVDVSVESGMGEPCYHSDEDYKEAGATIVTDRGQGLGAADMILRIRKPPEDEIDQMKDGAIHISFLDPFNNPELTDKLAGKGISAISMEMMPRTTIAQKMDAISSQANIAGYYAVILGATRLKKILPMMMTPAGTLKPSRVFVIGAGVAGLQAIATAKRLGARVEAFDTRPVVEEQVQSLGAKFVKIDLGETGQTDQGYAKELTDEQKALQQEGMAKVCEQADVVITTAQVFGRKAPIIVTRDMVERMKPGSVVVDLAIESGGNVEGAEFDKEVDINGVNVIGLANLPGRVCANASQMYSANLSALVEHFWDNESKEMKLDLEDEIMAGALVTHDGEIRHEMIKGLRG